MPLVSQKACFSLLKQQKSSKITLRKTMFFMKKNDILCSKTKKTDMESRLNGHDDQAALCQ